MTTERSPEPDAALLESGRAVRLLTLNRPSKLNAFDTAMWTDLADALDRATDDPEVAAVVITGAGRAFCSGQDLSEMEDMADFEGENPPERLMRTLLGYPKPLIAAVNGVAAGFGFSLVAHCDLVFMAASARLNAPFVRIGLSADGALSAVLPERIGWARAARLLLEGGWMDAQGAVDCGLALERCEDGEVLDAALAAAEAIAVHPVEAVRATKELLVAGRVDAWRAALDRESAVFDRLSRSDAHRSAIAAFLGS